MLLSYVGGNKYSIYMIHHHILVCICDTGTYVYEWLEAVYNKELFGYVTS